MPNDVILSAILFTIKSPVTSQGFLTTLLEAVFATSILVLYDVYPIISVIFTLSSISSGLLFWSVNHNWIDCNPALVVFSIVNKWGKIEINWPNCLLGTKVNNSLDACW